MHKIRLRFSKSGNLKFIGHLDLLKVFQQTIRRTGLPASYSQGFNPHLLLSFALPLPLGMDSLNDYADLILEEEKPNDEIVKTLNDNAPSGLFIKDAYDVKTKAASIVSIADYKLQVDVAEEKIKKIIDSSEIVIPKKTKSGIKDTNIRPDILNIENKNETILMRLSAGSARFLHPMVVAELLIDEKPNPSLICRTELYQANMETL